MQRVTFLAVLCTLAWTTLAQTQTGVIPVQITGTDGVVPSVTKDMQAAATGIGASIEGVITKSGGSEPLMGVKVLLISPDGTTLAARSATTDSKGYYRFPEIQPGQYRVVAESEGFVRQEYGNKTRSMGTILPVSSGQRLTIPLTMLPSGVVAGRILDGSGNPVVRVEVRAYAYQYVMGKRLLTPITADQTNDRGEYRLFWLAPGDYVIGLSHRGKRESISEERQGTTITTIVTQGNFRSVETQPSTISVAQVQALAAESLSPMMYFPGTDNAGEAQALNIVPGAELTGINIVLHDIPRSYAIRGMVNSSVSLQRFAVRAQRLEAGESVFASAPAAFRGVPVTTEGSFEIGGLARGTYLLTASATGSPIYIGQRTVDVRNGDVEDVSITVGANVEIAGRVVAASPPPQFQMNSIVFAVVPPDSIVAISPVRQSRVRQDGTFTLNSVVTQENRIHPTGLISGAYIEAVRFGSTTSIDAVFTPSRANGALEVVIGFSAAQITGTVLSNDARPYPGGLVVLAPGESRRGRMDLYLSTLADENGQFALKNVPPGDYRLYAWDDVPAGAHQSPEFIQRFSEYGQSVIVERNESLRADVRLISTKR